MAEQVGKWVERKAVAEGSIKRSAGGWVGRRVSEGVCLYGWGWVDGWVRWGWVRGWVRGGLYKTCIYFKTFFPYYCRSKFFQEMTTNVNMLSACVKSLSLFTLGNLHCTKPKKSVNWIRIIIFYFSSSCFNWSEVCPIAIPEEFFTGISNHKTCSSMI